MKLSKVKCPNCGAEIDIDDILAQDIKAQVVAEEHEKHSKELEKIKIQAEKAANDQLAAKLELAEQKKNQQLVNRTPFSLHKIKSICHNYLWRCFLHGKERSKVSTVHRSI